MVIGHGYFSGETALGCEVRILVGASPAVTACSLTQSLYLGVDETVPEQNSARGVFAATSWRAAKVSPVVKEERYFTPINDAQGGDPAGDQSSRDGGVVPKHKVPGKIVPRVGFPRWFPGEFSQF